MNLREKYNQIACSVSGRVNTAFQSGVCPDQFVGSMRGFDGSADDFPLRRTVTRLDNSPCVVLVMESPHIDEFIGEWGPAKGKTGVQIRKYIATIVTGLGGQLSELFLINAIQHQCSLGIATRHYRDNVFRALWASGGASDFERRLMQVYRPGDMLFNCCTGSDPHNGLRQLVTAAIRNSLGTVPLHSGPHPFSWFSARNRLAIRLISAQQCAVAGTSLQHR